VVGAYFIGSIDFGVLVPRLFGFDIYAHGSGNPGATNVLRSMGKKVAAVVVVGDLSKGFLAAMLGGLSVGPTVAAACAFAAVVGHCFPVWHRLRGGKGVAAAGGAAFWLEPLAGVAVLGVWLLVVGVTRRASVASLTVCVVYVPVMVAFGHRGWPLVWMSAMAVLIVGRHHANIRRLLGGSEHAIESS
jgi:acyl phosphate:glycerol-3-phosphate acyltransferase